MLTQSSTRYHCILTSFFQHNAISRFFLGNDKGTPIQHLLQRPQKRKLTTSISKNFPGQKIELNTKLSTLKMTSFLLTTFFSVFPLSMKMQCYLGNAVRNQKSVKVMIFFLGQNMKVLLKDFSSQRLSFRDRYFWRFWLF